ncbi:MAG: helix-turn-helix domain-containing protein [Caldilineaceae bacterium]
MKKDNIEAARKTAIHLLRSGYTTREVASKCQRSSAWVRKWRSRYEAEGWAGLASRSQAPKRHGQKISAATRRAILRTRSELEADAASGKGLKYIGARAVRTRLKQKRLKRVPSRATIERVLREAGVTRSYQSKQAETKVKYPRLAPTAPHELIQVDIVPHFLTGGSRMPCFNAIDVVSRYPTGLAFPQRRSLDAVEFLIHTWQEIGIPRYTQVDNEGCFSGGATHPYVLGRVARLALQVGTELVFSPVYHPASNGYIERFHQEYDLHVWEDTYLANQAQVNQQAVQFFAAYRESLHHSALNEQSPNQLHRLALPVKLDHDFSFLDKKPPLYVGRIHFMRKVNVDKTVTVLNASWPLASALPDQGVWVTLTLAPTYATLQCFDSAPTASKQTLLAIHPFPIAEPILPRPGFTTAIV